MAQKLNKPRGPGDYGGKMVFGNCNSCAQDCVPTTRMIDLIHLMTAIRLHGRDGARRGVQAVPQLAAFVLAKMPRQNYKDYQ